MNEFDTDEQILEGCRQGSRQAFARLYERHQRRVFSVALNFFGGDRSTAEDVTQAVFLKLFDKLDSFRSEAGLSTWIYRLATNACIDERRRAKRMSFFADIGLLFRAKPAGEGGHERRETVTEVRSALRDLDEKYRLPLILRYSEGLSYEEIAAVLDCSAGTVASRLNRGHKLLAEKLGHLRDAR